MTRRILFVCSRNRLRSPTAEQVFAAWPAVETASDGVSGDADVPISAELLHWAKRLAVMEPVHRSKLNARFKVHLAGKRIVCLNVPDDFGYMDEALVTLLRARVAPHLPRG